MRGQGDDRGNRHEHEHRRVSRWLAWLLRHGGPEAGVPVDGRGWADVESVLTAARAAGIPLDGERLAQVVDADPKGRYELGPGPPDRIRAVHGHSLPVEAGPSVDVPPPLLYHGTIAPALDAIRAEGLRPGARRYVHLSETVATAVEVGRRRGRPVVLTVDALGLHHGGHPLHRSASGVWLVEAVPVRYLTFPDGGVGLGAGDLER